MLTTKTSACCCLSDMLRLLRVLPLEALSRNPKSADLDWLVPCERPNTKPNAGSSKWSDGRRWRMEQTNLGRGHGGFAEAATYADLPTQSAKIPF